MRRLVLLIHLLGTGATARAAPGPEAEFCLSNGQSLVGFPEPEAGGTRLNLAHGSVWIPPEGRGLCSTTLRATVQGPDLRTILFRDRQVLYATPGETKGSIPLTLTDGTQLLAQVHAIDEVLPPPSRIAELAEARDAWERQQHGGRATPAERRATALLLLGVGGVVCGGVVVGVAVSTFTQFRIGR